MRERPPWYPEVTHEPPDEPAYAEDGVDMTLVRAFLDLTPAERLAHLDAMARFAARFVLDEAARD